MRNIEVALLQGPNNAGKIGPFLARLTQRGHLIKSMDDVIDLFNKPASKQLISSLANMPHGTIKRFDTYTFAIYGASRRFLAQIRTHQLADFVSGSLQYSDFSDAATPFNYDDMRKMFVVPYKYLEDKKLELVYLDAVSEAYYKYCKLARHDNDAAGYVMPNGIRNVLIMQANLQEWQYIIGLRTCRRNSDETRYVMYRIWEQLRDTENGELLFNISSTGCGCQQGACLEGHMCCQNPIHKLATPTNIIEQDFPLLVR